MSTDVSGAITAVATAVLAVFAIVTAIYAIRAFRKQSKEVSEQAKMLKVQSDQLDEQRKTNERQAEVLALQLHDPDPGTPIEESWQTVCDLIGQGTVRAAGLSNHPVDLMDRARAIGPVAVVQHQYSLLHRAPQADGVLAWCKRRWVPFLAWSPLAGRGVPG
jgi:aryl-alcohol dehydrogenase-like predicted oxidoreductase